MPLQRLQRSRSQHRLVLALACVLASACLHAQQIAITFDDLPAHGPLPAGVTRTQVIKDILAALSASGTPPVYGFVNGVRLQEEPHDAEVLDLWRKAGYPLGNHTWSHMNLNDHSVAEWEADLLRNEPVLQSRMPERDWRWVRFPYLAEGNTQQKISEVRKFLADRQYRVAGVTMSFGDYLFNEPYVRCSEKRDNASIQTLENVFLQAAYDDLKDRRAMMKAAFGRPIPLVLLMHVGAFDARMLPRLLQLYKAEGAQFISLQDAEQNEFYRNDLDLKLPAMPDTLEAILARRQISVPRHTSPADALDKLCR